MMSIVEREKATRVILGLQRGYRVILSLCDVNCDSEFGSDNKRSMSHIRGSINKLVNFVLILK